VYLETREAYVERQKKCRTRDKRGLFGETKEACLERQKRPVWRDKRGLYAKAVGAYV